MAPVMYRADYADAYTNLGLTLRRLGRHKAAIGAYERALDFNPDDLVTLRNLMMAAELVGDEERVARCASDLARLQPEDAEAQATYAILLFQYGRYAEAAQVYERLVLLDPGVAGDFYNLGLCHFSLERWDSAEASWRQALEFDPRHASANKGLAVLYWSKGDYEAAWQAVAQCEGLAIPLDPEFLERLGRDSGPGYAK